MKRISNTPLRKAVIRVASATTACVVLSGCFCTPDLWRKEYTSYERMTGTLSNEAWTPDDDGWTTVGPYAFHMDFRPWRKLLEHSKTIEDVAWIGNGSTADVPIILNFHLKETAPKAEVNHSASGAHVRTVPINGNNSARRLIEDERIEGRYALEQQWSNDVFKQLNAEEFNKLVQFTSSTCPFRINASAGTMLPTIQEERLVTLKLKRGTFSVVDTQYERTTAKTIRAIAFTPATLVADTGIIIGGAIFYAIGVPLMFTLFALPTR